MCNRINEISGHRRSVGRGNQVGQRLWLRATLLLAIAFNPLVPLRSEEQKPATVVDEEFVRRSTVADQVADLEKEVFEATDRDALAECSAKMQTAADLAKSKFGERHWMTTYYQSLADGFRSVNDLPSTQQDLYLDALNIQFTAVRLASQGNRDMALKELRRAHEKCVAALGADHVLRTFMLIGISAEENRLGAPEVAKKDALTAISLAAERWGRDHPKYANGLRCLARAECQLNEYESAEDHAQQAIAILEPVAAEDLSDKHYRVYAMAHWDLARVRNEQGRHAEAEMPARRAMELLAPFPVECYFDTLISLLELARSESGQGKYRQAEITFTAIRRIQLAKFPPELAASIKAAYDEHIHRARPEAARKDNRRLNRR